MVIHKTISLTRIKFYLPPSLRLQYLANDYKNLRTFSILLTVNRDRMTEFYNTNPELVFFDLKGYKRIKASLNSLS